MTTFGSTVDEVIDRGPPDEARMTEHELRGAAAELDLIKMTNGEKATVIGLMNEMKVLRAIVDDALDANNKLIGLYMTLRGEFDQYKKQRAIELQSWLANGGSTTPEDMDGSQSGSGN